MRGSLSCAVQEGGRGYADRKVERVQGSGGVKSRVSGRNGLRSGVALGYLLSPPFPPSIDNFLSLCLVFAFSAVGPLYDLGDHD